MSVVTEAELRAQLGVPRRGAVVSLAADARLTPAAADLVRSYDLELVDADPDGAAAPALVGPANGSGAGRSEAGVDPPGWDRPGRFPVVLDGPVPTCVTCGGEVRGKPSHLTQLDAARFAPKTAPRIRLRGRFDTLQALTNVIAARARAEGPTWLVEGLDTLAAYCRELLAAEYHLRSPGPLVMLGLDEDTLHQATHHPDEAVGLPHLVPDASHPELLHWLNLLRCQVREAEVLVLDAFPPELAAGGPGEQLARAVNRLSSAVYVLELRLAAQGAR